MSANVIELRDTIFVNDRRYAPSDWEKAFIEFHEIIERARHCTQRLRIGMINIEYHPNKCTFVAYGSSFCPTFSVVPGVKQNEQLQSASPDKASVSFGFIYFATERTKRTWRINLKGFTLIFSRSEQNALRLAISGTMPKTAPLQHEDCS